MPMLTNVFVLKPAKTSSYFTIFIIFIFAQCPWNLIQAERKVNKLNKSWKCFLNLFTKLRSIFILVTGHIYTGPASHVANMKPKIYLSSSFFMPEDLRHSLLLKNEIANALEPDQGLSECFWNVV